MSYLYPGHSAAQRQQPRELTFAPTYDATHVQTGARWGNGQAAWLRRGVGVFGRAPSLDW